MRQCWMSAAEPPLADVIDDPIVRLVMRRDRLSRQDVWEAVDRASKGLAKRQRHRLDPKIDPTQIF